MKFNSLSLILVMCFWAFEFSSSAQIQDLNEAQELHKKEYLNSFHVELKKGVKKLSCKNLELNNSLLSNAQKRINYFRKMVGQDTVQLLPELNIKAQHAAILMSKNDQLSHSPNKSWKCFSQLSMDAAANSNLRFYDLKDFNEERVNPINGFIEDYGTSNKDLGHRRWILYSKLKEVGYGTTCKSETIYISSTLSVDNPVDDSTFIAYPPNGYIPAELVFPKWSFGIPSKLNPDFSKAQVTVKDLNGTNIKVKKYRLSKENYGDPSLVWEVDNIFKDLKGGYSEILKSYMNSSFFVEIINVMVNGEPRNFRYEVKIFIPEL